MKNIVVSINCITYNHRDYIADAIESFLMQKTNFDFEILIHDDASTDGTAEIIREYEKKYPDIIKPIYQTFNQYSQGKKIFMPNAARAKGKYTAICEGDDYWTDPYKIQKQVDFMERHPECSLCVHAGNMVSASDKKIINRCRPNRGNKVYTVEEVIEYGGALFMTNSMFYQTKLAQNIPEFFNKVNVSDYPLTIYLALQGTVYYLDEYMSAYRLWVSGSWTEKNLSNIESFKKHFDTISNMLDEINQYTGFKYKDIIIRTKKRNQFDLLLKQEKFKEAFEDEYRFIFSEFNYKTKVRWFLQWHFPSILMSLLKIKRKLMI
ncbi:glycosyltransferase family 2 protein [Bacillus sp. B-jedd]|uniref:glycosyltransferase family 2 protein n=1 Tax=Bacillus sp. B-jedd TaxID=1476857 RepID=UPI0005155566|nr:glycosyltransferase [Bacillus sp. B-jedd]CEG28648.1 putative glycosyltransferase [Bacillus sp. B-jedd]